MKKKRQMAVDENDKSFILKSLDLISIDSNEAERTVAPIGLVVQVAVRTLRSVGVEASFRAQHIYSEENKRDFITDFELYEGKALFHIIEAKGATGLSGAKDQIRQQLAKTNCENGCITDGFVWQFVKFVENDIKYVDGPFAIKTELDLIFDHIFSAVTFKI